MKHPRQSMVIVLAVSCALWSFAGDDPPPPSPTPKPGTLAAIATARSLNRAPGVDESTPIVITNDNLERLGDGAALTVLTSTIAEAGEIETTKIDPKTREKWRRKVLAQSASITKLEAQGKQIETEIDRLGRGRLDGRALDRIAKAESKLRSIDEEIKRAKAQLSRIVREARKEGAQPGWFR